MKRLASISLPIVISGLLSGCGGEALLNEPTTDMNSCVVGSWTNGNKDSLPKDTYSQNYTFFADGTFRYDHRYKLPYSVGLILYLGGAEDFIPRYNIISRIGAWEYKDGIFYIAEQHEQGRLGATESDALEAVAAVMRPAVPLRNSPSGSTIKGEVTHCDEEYFVPEVYKKTSEVPFVYETVSISSNRYLDPNVTTSKSYTLNSNGTAEYSYSKEILRDPEENKDEEYDREYYYEGNLLYIVNNECESCDSEPDFVDHGHSLTRINGAYFVRQ